MRTDDIQALTRAVPFRPFRMVMNSGRTYDVRHPEMVRVSKTYLLAFYPDPNDPTVERFDMLEPLLIETITNLEVPTAAPPADANGAAP